MPTQKQVAKATAKTLLSLSLLATYAVKYGLDFSAELSKKTLDSAESMTNYFLDSKVPKLGIGDALFNKTVAGADWALDQTIKLQKALLKAKSGRGA